MYGGDRLFAYLRRGRHATTTAVAAFEGAGFHVERCALAELHDIGAQMITWELATAYCGALLHINPFDQPNVQAAKDYVVAAPSTATSADRPPRRRSADGDLSEALLATAERGRSFVVIQAYVTPTAEQRGALLQGLRRQLRDRARRGHPARLRPPLPALHGPAAQGRPAAGHLPAGAGGYRLRRRDPGPAYGFRTVIEAQSRGDAQALRATGQPVARVNMADVADTVRAALGAG